jgi:hypothetical protein
VIITLGQIGKDDPNFLKILPDLKKWSKGGDRESTEHRIHVCLNLKESSLKALAQPSALAETNHSQESDPCKQGEATSIPGTKEMVQLSHKIQMDKIVDEQYPEISHNEVLRKAMTSCIHCHSVPTEGARRSGPYLPFEEKSKFKPKMLEKIKFRISEEAVEKGYSTMPAGLDPLSKKDQKQFMKLLKHHN